MASALACLRLFGIDMPAHPTQEQVQAEYETVWRILDGRPIESLIDLPMMTDPEMLAAMQVLSVLPLPRLSHRLSFVVPASVPYGNIGMEHGTSGASAYGCADLGESLDPYFTVTVRAIDSPSSPATWSRSTASSPIERRSTIMMAVVAVWTQPIATSIDFLRTAIRAATETGDPTVAGYCMDKSVTNLLLRNDPLDAVWRESEIALEFVRKARFHDVEDVIVSQQRFIATMQGRTSAFSTFSDAQFDEAAFEAQITGGGSPRGLSVLDPQIDRRGSCRATTSRRSRQPTRRKRCFGPLPSNSRGSTTSTTPR